MCSRLAARRPSRTFSLLRAHLSRKHGRHTLSENTPFFRTALLQENELDALKLVIKVRSPGPIYDYDYDDEGRESRKKRRGARARN